MIVRLDAHGWIVLQNRTNEPTAFKNAQYMIQKATFLNQNFPLGA